MHGLWPGSECLVRHVQSPVTHVVCVPHTPLVQMGQLKGRDPPDMHHQQLLSNLLIGSCLCALFRRGVLALPPCLLGSDEGKAVLACTY